MRPGATCPEPPLARQWRGWGTVAKDHVPALRAVSSNWEATTAPHVYAEEEHRLPRGFLAMAHPLLRQPRVNLPGTHPRRGTAAHALPTHSALGSIGPRQSLLSGRQEHRGRSCGLLEV